MSLPTRGTQKALFVAITNISVVPSSNTSVLLLALQQFPLYKSSRDKSVQFIIKHCNQTLFTIETSNSANTKNTTSVITTSNITLFVGSLSTFFLCHTQLVHSVPFLYHLQRTNRIFVPGKSKDAFCQRNLVQNVIENFARIGSPTKHAPKETGDLSICAGNNNNSANNNQALSLKHHSNSARNTPVAPKYPFGQPASKNSVAPKHPYGQLTSNKPVASY